MSRDQSSEVLIAGQIGSDSLSHNILLSTVSTGETSVRVEGSMSDADDVRGTKTTRRGVATRQMILTGLFW